MNCYLRIIEYPRLKLDNCIHYQLHKEEIVLITSPNKSQHFEDYKNEGSNDFFITNEEGCSYRSMFETYLTNNEITQFQTMELWSLEAIKQAVMSGLGFSVLPYITVKNEIEKGSLIPSG